MASTLKAKHPAMAVHSLGLHTIAENSEIQLPASLTDAAPAASSYRTGREAKSDSFQISRNGASNSRTPALSTLSKNLLDPGDSVLLPLKKDLSGLSKTSQEKRSLQEHVQNLDVKELVVTPQHVGKQQPGHRTKSGLTKPATAAQSRWKELRVTWMDLPEYYSTNRHTSTAVEVSHNTLPTRPDCGGDDALPTALHEDNEHIPGDHWGSLKHAGMSINRALTDPEFASKWKTDQEKSAGFISMIQTLFNQVQEAAWPTPCQGASLSRRLLITITIMGRVGALRLWVTEDTRVKEAIELALLAYAKEARLPALGMDTSNFELYLSPYTRSALDRDEKICDTGARSFVLWGPGLAGPDQRRPKGISTSCAQEHHAVKPSTYTSLHLYDSGAESPPESSTLAKFQHQRVIPGLPWLPSTLMRCIPV